LGSIKCKALIAPTRTDQYFVVGGTTALSVGVFSSIVAIQPEDSEIEVKHLPHGTLSVVETIYGHVGGGGGGNQDDNEFIDAAVKKFLS
jgi:homoserine O-acetyltransferase